MMISDAKIVNGHIYHSITSTLLYLESKMDYDHIWSTSPHVYVDYTVEDTREITDDLREVVIKSVCLECNVPNLVFMIKNDNGMMTNYNEDPAVIEVYNDRLRYFYYDDGIPSPVNNGDPVELLIENADTSVMQAKTSYRQHARSYPRLRSTYHDVSTLHLYYLNESSNDYKCYQYCHLQRDPTTIAVMITVYYDPDNHYYVAVDRDDNETIVPIREPDTNTTYCPIDTWYNYFMQGFNRQYGWI